MRFPKPTTQLLEIVYTEIPSRSAKLLLKLVRSPVWESTARACLNACMLASP